MDATTDNTEIFAMIAGVLIFIALLIGLIRWAVTDAESRGKSPLLVTIAVLFFFPMGLIAWILFRPSRIENNRRFNLEDYRVQ
jgi:hypothetical protein